MGEIKKTVNIIERTLDKDKKDFITICKIGEIFSMVLTGISVIMSIALLIMLIMSLTGFVDDSGKYSSPEGIMSSANNLIMTLGIIIACNFSAHIFNKLKDGETPFRYDIADKIKGAGISLTVSGVICSVIECVRGILDGTGIFTDTPAFEPLDFESYCIFGVFLITLAYVFNYGCKLQHEADETV